MSCCGHQRQQLGGIPPRSAAATSARVRRTVIGFEYVGATALTVTGPASGRVYRFEAPGVRLIVDARDRPGLARLRNLREIV